MHFVATSLTGVWKIELDRVADERGYFSRTFCAREFEAQGLATAFPQSSISFNQLRGTLRGMHWQSEPHGECKLIRVTRGASRHVVLDLRDDSATCGCWHVEELAADSPTMLYIPTGCAHGFLTLCDDTEISYQISVPYEAASARGIRWNSPILKGAWPFDPLVISQRDCELPLAE